MSGTGLDNMNKNSINILCFICLIAISAKIGYHDPLPDYLINKMNRAAIKIWGKNINFSKKTHSESISDHHIFKINLADSLAGYAIVSRALGCKIGGCSVENTKESSFEEFYYITLVNTNHKIQQVKVLEYTSDYGYQIANKGWLKQFQQGGKFTVNENIDAISGATISVNSITQGVNDQLNLLTKLH